MTKTFENDDDDDNVNDDDDDLSTISSTNNNIILTKNGLSDVNEKYELLEIIGSGSYGTVRKCQHRQTKELFAVKTIEKDNVDDVKVLRREISILASLHHPHILQFYDVYEDIDAIHIVTELCTGGELYDKVIEMAESPEGHFHEHDAALLIRDILDAIRYCHDVAHIVHRDLKPENFLLQHPGNDAPLKIIDFGLSRKDDADFGIMKSRVGTPYYVAPEVLAESYTYKCDIWSIGVIAYILLCGYAPFNGADDMETIFLVETAKLDFPSPEWDTISEDAKDFVTQLLQRDAFMRPTAVEALRHVWLTKHDPTLLSTLEKQLQKEKEKQQRQRQQQQNQQTPPPTPPEIPKPRPFSSTETLSLLLSSISEEHGEHTDISMTTTSSTANTNTNKSFKDLFESNELTMQSDRRSAFQKFLVTLKLKKRIMSSLVPSLTSSSSNKKVSSITLDDNDNDHNNDDNDEKSAILTPQERMVLTDILKQVDQDKDGMIAVEDIDEALQKHDSHGGTGVASGTGTASKSTATTTTASTSNTPMGPTNFSSSVKRNLQEMRQTLASYPKMSLKIKPILKLIEATTMLPNNNNNNNKKRNKKNNNTDDDMDVDTLNNHDNLHNMN